MPAIEKVDGVLAVLRDRVRLDYESGFPRPQTRDDEHAIKALLDYRAILAGTGTLVCPQGHEYDLHSVDPCDIPF